ncbi:hypothetical protein SAB1893c [Staphylococcus aureus RF122]|nr:hypothetical protein SAB1893c [Staphylococcus aureus RF122]
MLNCEYILLKYQINYFVFLALILLLFTFSKIRVQYLCWNFKLHSSKGV